MRNVFLAVFLFLALPLEATTYYCNKTGTDGAGHTGLVGDPWLTIAYSLTRITSGDTILIGDGTYAETSGSGYLQPATAYTSETLLASQSGDPYKVTITGASGANNLWIRGDNLSFSNLTFSTKATTDTTAVYFDRGGNVKFIGCVFIPPDADSKWAVDCESNTTCSNYTFSSCTITQSGTHLSRGIQLFYQSAPVTNHLITNCFISVSGTAVALKQTLGVSIINSTLISTNVYGFNGAQNYISTNTLISGCTVYSGASDAFNAGQALNMIVSNCSITAASANHAMILGLDAVYASGTAGLMNGTTVTGCRITNTVANNSSHVLLMGANCTNCVADHNIINATGGGFALVIKENTGNTAYGNTIYAGNQSCIAIKGCTNALVTRNILFGSTTCTNALRAYKGDTGNKFDHLTATNNWILCTFPNSRALYWGSSAEDGGGGICDYNAYFFIAAPAFGVVIVTNSLITSLELLKSSWSTYGVPDNDAHSYYGPTFNPGFAQ